MRLAPPKGGAAARDMVSTGIGLVLTRNAIFESASTRGLTGLSGRD